MRSEEDFNGSITSCRTDYGLKINSGPMDIFHVITQEIEHIVSCHWLDEFRGHHRSNRPSRASTPVPDRSAESERTEGEAGQSGASSILSRANSFQEHEEHSTSRQASMDNGTTDNERGGEQTK